MNSIYQSQQEQVIRYAKEVIEQKPVYLDTETTGLSSNDEVIELTIVDHDGSLLFSRLFRPLQPIPRQAQLIHHITDQMVAAEKPWPWYWTEIRNLLYGRVIAAYNAPFDQQMLQQTHRKHGFAWRDKFNFLDIMQLYSQFRGLRDPIRGGLRLFKLEEAARSLEIPIHETHRAESDAMLTRAILLKIAGIPG